MTVRGFTPVAGDSERLVGQVSDLVGHDYSVTLCAATTPGAERLSVVLGEGGMHAPTREAASGTPGAVVVTAALSSGFILPD